MDSSEFNIFEDQAYINPTLSSGEQMAFIDKFRDIQNQNNQQIATDTYNLGKALPSNLGGLGGGEAYFNSRYQNDQVDDMVANLKTAAQAQALNDVMSNYQNQLKRRYSNAQKAYNRRHGSSGSYYTTGGNNGTGGDPVDNLDISTNGQKGGGFWDTWLGKKTSDWMSDVINNGTKINANKGTWQSIGNNVYKNSKTGEVINTKISGADAMLLDGAFPGLWPNGTKKTEGSTYTSPSGKTYTIKSGLSNNAYDIVEISGR